MSNVPHHRIGCFPSACGRMLKSRARRAMNWGWVGIQKPVSLFLVFLESWTGEIT
jgi:hypothetical protein